MGELEDTLVMLHAYTKVSRPLKMKIILHGMGIITCRDMKHDAGSMTGAKCDP